MKKVEASSKLTSFQAVRSTAAKFVTDRDWTQFHTPTNVALALTGEVGEVAEIFQWKGPMDAGDSGVISDAACTATELVHIGEEVADVFIYSTRLCDLCGIDLGYCARYCALNPDAHERGTSDDFLLKCVQPGPARSWDALTFAELEALLPSEFVTEVSSPRRVALLLSSKCGQVCDLFQVKTEAESAVGLPGWSRSEVADLGLLMGAIAVLLLRLALLARTTLDSCVAGKFEKNERKYPAELAKGSSQKYTAYANVVKAKEESGAAGDSGSGSNEVHSLRVTVAGSLALCAVSLAVGAYFGRAGGWRGLKL